MAKCRPVLGLRRWCHAKEEFISCSVHLPPAGKWTRPAGDSSDGQDRYRAIAGDPWSTVNYLNIRDSVRDRERSVIRHLRMRSARALLEFHRQKPENSSGTSKPITSSRRVSRRSRARRAVRNWQPWRAHRRVWSVVCTLCAVVHSRADLTIRAMYHMDIRCNYCDKRFVTVELMVKHEIIWARRIKRDEFPTNHHVFGIC